jgi:hypothetical protein
MNCHLLIPVLSPPPQWIDAGLLREMHLPALETLLARGRQTPLPPGGMEAWLCRAFGVEQQQDWPVAAFTLLADGGNPGSDFWLRADPVHLQLQHDRMVLVDAGHLEISADEAASLTAALNHHFAQNGLTFLPTRPGCWHLRLDRPARLETHPLEAVIGRNIRNFLPGGPDGKHWHNLLNEIQMLLHSHPVNEKREQRSALPVNSIWPWGGGVLPKVLSAPYAQVWANDALASGLATAAGVSRAGIPATAAEWQRQAAPGLHLIVLDMLRSSALPGDFPRWRDNMLRLEDDWFGPLRQALSRGQLAGLSLHVFADTPAQTFSVNRADLWKIWRGRKPLKSFAGELSS